MQGLPTSTVLAAITALALLAPGAAAQDTTTPSRTGPTGPSSAPPPEVPLGPSRPASNLIPGPTTKVSYVARVVATTFAKTRPWGANRRKLQPRATWGGGASQLMVLDSVEVVRDARRPRDQRLWVEVALPQRPNESAGWVPADYLQIRKIRYRIHVSTDRRLVQVYRDGKRVRRFKAVVGKAATPTPTGLFATNEHIRQPDRRAFLGPWALHLTAFSNVLFDFGGGPGRVAIHGRAGASLRDPLGTARSNGCIRIANEDVNWLARRIEAGTPVRIERGLPRPGRV